MADRSTIAIQAYHYGVLASALTALVGASDGHVVAIAGHTTAGDGGQGFARWHLGSTTTANGGTVWGAGTGRWKRIYTPGSVAVGWFGARSDGETVATDDTVAVQAAIDAAFTSGEAVDFPNATTMVSSIGARNGTTLRGCGHGGYAGLANKSVIKQNAAGAGLDLITRHASHGTGAVYNVTIRDLRLAGTDGNGGTGLALTGFTSCVFENLYIGPFRNAGDTGIGIYLLNSATAQCFGNTFNAVMIGDCDTGLKMDSASAATSCGYHRFFGLTIYQEVTCINMLSTAANGSIYNIFNGVLLQGNNGGGKGIVCAGIGNYFAGVTMDAVSGNNLEFTSASSSNTFFGNISTALSYNNQVSGGANTVYGNGFSGGGFSNQFTLQDVKSGDTKLTLTATGVSYGPTLTLATDDSSIKYRLMVQNGGSGAALLLMHKSSNLVTFGSDLATTLYGKVAVSAGTATPAGGSATAVLLFGTTSGFGIYYGSGAPTVSAGQGSIYMRSDGSSTSTRQYVNTNGSTTWTAVTTAA